MPEFRLPCQPSACGTPCCAEILKHAKRSYVLCRNSPETAARVPDSCLHNGSGLVTFASAATVKKIVVEAPLREIKGKQIHLMYTEIGSNNVLQ